MTSLRNALFALPFLTLSAAAFAGAGQEEVVSRTQKQVTFQHADGTGIRCVDNGGLEDREILVSLLLPRHIREGLNVSELQPVEKSYGYDFTVCNKLRSEFAYSSAVTADLLRVLSTRPEMRGSDCVRVATESLSLIFNDGMELVGTSRFLGDVVDASECGR